MDIGTFLLPNIAMMSHFSWVWVFRLKDIPKIVADILGVNPINVIHDKEYRKVEIMKFSPAHPLLTGWNAKTTLKEKLPTLIKKEGI